MANCLYCGNVFIPVNGSLYCNKSCYYDAAQAKKKVVQQEKKCVVCDKGFLPTRKDLKYCSDSCRKQAYSKKVEHTPKICAWCGEEFIPLQSQQQAYCTKSCRNRADLERNREKIYKYQREYKRKKHADNPKSKRRDTKHKIIDGVECAKCSVCKKWLPITSFNKKASVSDGINTQCKECIRQYAIKSADRIRAEKKIYGAENRERLNAYKKKWAEESGIDRTEYFREYRETNRSEINHRANERFKREDVKEKCRHTVIARRTRKKNAPATLTAEEWVECLEYFDYKDAYTGRPMRKVSRDHVIPLINGGGYTKDNIVPCENSINKRKNSSDMETWYRKQPFFTEERLRKIKQWTSTS